MKIVILLTATINPGNIVFTERNDPLKRLSDYLKVLDKYSKLNHELIFVENSGYPLKNSGFKKYESLKNVELLQSYGNESAKLLGKGIGEYELIDFALQNTTKIFPEDYILKITGRYNVVNLTQIIKQICKNNTPLIHADLKRNLTFADSRVFAFKSNFFYTYLAQFKDQLNDNLGIFFEHCLSKAILSAIIDNQHWAFLNPLPVIEGIDGSQNISIRNDLLTRLKLQLAANLTTKCIQRY